MTRHGQKGRREGERIGVGGVWVGQEFRQLRRVLWL